MAWRRWAVRGAALGGVVGVAAWYLRPEHPLPDQVKRDLRTALLKERQGDMASASQHYDLAVHRVIEQNGERSWQTASVTATAGVHFAEKARKLDRAGELLTQGWILLVQQQRYAHAVSVAQTLSGVLVELKQYAQAESLLNAALALVEEHGSTDRALAQAQAPLLEQLASTQLAAHRFSESVATYTQALPAVERQYGKSSCEAGMVLLNMAVASTELGDTASSRRLLGRALAINERPQCVQSALGATLLAKAAVFDREGDAVSAREALALADRAAIEHDDSITRRVVAEARTRIASRAAAQPRDSKQAAAEIVE